MGKRRGLNVISFHRLNRQKRSTAAAREGKWCKRLPGNKFIDGANTAEKFIHLIAHDIKHLTATGTTTAMPERPINFLHSQIFTSYVAKLSRG